MSLFFKLLDVCIKVIMLFFIISFERVIGFPVLFLTVAVSLMLVSRSITRYIFFIFAAFLLAIFYQFSFILSFLIITVLYVGFIFGTQIIESNLQRFLLLLVLCVGVVGTLSDVGFTVWLILQLVLSLAFAAVFLLKYLFVKYGFIGKRFVRS